MSSNANERQVGGEHYRSSTFQHWDLCWELKLGHLPSAITKYGTRHAKKNGREDVEKALHYADKYLEVIRRVEVPYPRDFERSIVQGEHETLLAPYTPEVAAYVQREVVRYCAANDLGPKESAVIAFLCHPHDSSAITEVQELLRSILVDEYQVPKDVVYGSPYPIPAPRYPAAEDHTGEEGNGPHGFGYVEQDHQTQEQTGNSTLSVGDGDFRVITGNPEDLWPLPNN